MKNKKRIITIIIILITLILLIPIPIQLKDGGSVEYKAILYKVTNVKRLNSDIASEKKYSKGIIIEFLGMEIFNNVE